MELSKNMSKSNFRIIISFTLISVLSIASCSKEPYVSIRDTTFKQLAAVRSAKKKSVISHFEKLFKKATDAGSSDVLLNNFFSRRPNNKPLMMEIPTYSIKETSLDYYYVKNLNEFYDVLFIDKDGYIFNTIKRESDFRNNIFKGELAGSLLSKQLKSNPNVRFVDYDYYAPSKEAASFIVSPVKKNEVLAGWIIFQYSINTINGLLTIVDKNENLGNTGEVYLVNKNKVMLSQSRFSPKNTVMNFKVDTKSLKTALEKGIGQIVAEDYRGVRVFSSFEKISFMGNNWILVAEIDEDEVITKYFRQNFDYYIDKIFQKSYSGIDNNLVKKDVDANLIKVDINEYASGTKGDVLSTLGVSTCTGLIISYPGKFSYLGHIYPLDSTFFSTFEKSTINLLFRAKGEVFGDGNNDLFGRMFREIREFRIYPSEIRNLNVVIVAVHTDNMKTIIERVLDSGMTLSQIKVLYAPEMEYANILNSVGENEISISWVDAGRGKKTYSSPSNVKDLGVIVKEISGYSPI